MFHTVRYVLVALPLGLMLVGCSRSNHADFRPASAAAPSASPTHQSAARHVDGTVSGQNAKPATGREEVLGYVAPSDRLHDITLDEIRAHVRNQTAMFIDARGPLDFADGHIRGAFNMPAGRMQAYVEQLSQMATPDQLLIIYCNGPHCDSGDMVYEYLLSQGFTNMRVFKPGWAALASAKDLR
jgi:rhodanese-related sulfurtransferase